MTFSLAIDLTVPLRPLWASWYERPKGHIYCAFQMLLMISLQNSVAFAKNCSNSKFKKYQISVSISVCKIYIHLSPFFQVYLHTLITLIAAGQVALHTLQIIFQCPELFHNWNGHSLYENLKNSNHTPMHFKLKLQATFSMFSLNITFSLLPIWPIWIRWNSKRISATALALSCIITDAMWRYGQLIF